MGLALPLPLFNRNQGEKERATLALARAWQDRNRSDRAEESFRETIATNPGRLRFDDALHGIGGNRGVDFTTSVERFTFGLPELTEGIHFIPVMIGLFAGAEFLTQAGRLDRVTVRAALEADARSVVTTADPQEALR